MTRQAEAGFTLVEVLVSLALFAMIATAGVAVLDQVLRTQRLTEGRLDRLAGMQRMMHLVARDLSEATPGSLSGDAATVTLGRGADGVTVTYALSEGRMTRAVARGRGEARAQVLLPDVASIGWQYLDGSGAWRAAWPGAEAPARADLRAVAMTVTLPRGVGDLRRVVAVPRAIAP